MVVAVLVVVVVLVVVLGTKQTDATQAGTTYRPKLSTNQVLARRR